MSAAEQSEGWEQGCAFESGVVHDHGNAQCHQATAVKAAQSSVTAFLSGLAEPGQELALCDNSQCRVALYKVPAERGRSIPVCPGCYGSPS